jgi:hypothetical protein
MLLRYAYRIPEAVESIKKSVSEKCVTSPLKINIFRIIQIPTEPQPQRGSVGG